MEIEDKDSENMDALKAIRQKPRLESSQNILHVSDALVLLFYAIMGFTWDYDHLTGDDARFFVKLWATSIIFLQVLLVMFGCTAKFVKTDDRLEKWIFIRRLFHIILIIAFLLCFISGYHEILGFVIFAVSWPLQFFLTNLWKYTIKFEDIEERKGLVHNKAPTKFSSTGFDRFDDEN